MRQVDPALGHADFLGGRVRGRCEREERVVGYANVLGGDDDHAAGDVQGVFTALQHAREVVQRSVGVGAAHGFVEGGNGVVVLVAGAVVDEAFGEGGFECGQGRVGVVG